MEMCAVVYMHVVEILKCAFTRRRPCARDKNLRWREQERERGERRGRGLMSGESESTENVIVSNLKYENPIQSRLPHTRVKNYYSLIRHSQIFNYNYMVGYIEFHSVH